MKVWQHDVFEHKGKHWNIPTDNINWIAKDVAHKFGKGCDENGIIKQVGIAPGLYENKMLDMFMPLQPRNAQLNGLWSVG